MFYVFNTHVYERLSEKIVCAERFYAFICIKMHINGSGEEIWDQKGNHVN